MNIAPTSFRQIVRIDGTDEESRYRAACQLAVQCGPRGKGVGGGERITTTAVLIPPRVLGELFARIAPTNPLAIPLGLRGPEFPGLA